MRQKILHIALLLSPLVCYLEWGANKMFLFEMEYDLLTVHDSFSVLTHPAVCLPFLGQVLLLVTLFQKKPSRKLVWTAMILLGLLVFLILLGGIFSLNPKIVVSTLPFWITSAIAIRRFRKS